MILVNIYMLTKKTKQHKQSLDGHRAALKVYSHSNEASSQTCARSCHSHFFGVYGTLESVFQGRHWLGRGGGQTRTPE
jgi:hypothetical protein